MNDSRWNFDVKSLITGFLPAIVAVFIFNGTSRRAAGDTAIAADESGIYIMSNGTVRYIDKDKCRKSMSCFFSTQ